MLHRIAEPRNGFLTRVLRTPAALIFPDYDLWVPKHFNVLAVLTTPEGKRVIPAPNIVTNAGDQYYAQSAVAEAPTNDFDGANAGLRLGTAATSPTKTDTNVTTEVADTGSRKAVASTYPKTNDADADNTGAGTDIVTWLYSYAKGDFTATGIQEGAIVDNRTTPTAALTHFLFGASFNKTANDTLKVFVNHTFNGT